MSVTLLDEVSSFQDAMAIIAEIDFDDGKEECLNSHLEPLNSLLEDLFDMPVTQTTLPGLLENTKALDIELPAAQTETSIEKPASRTAKHRARKSGVSRRQELENLRHEVSMMQHKLLQLQERAKHRELTLETASANTGANPPLWKGVAVRQKTLREQAQARNVQLRAKLKTQIRMAKSLIRTLQSRQAGLLPLSTPAPKLQPQVQGEDDEGFSALLESMDNLFIGTDDMVRTTQMASLGTPHIRDAQIKRSLARGYQESRLLPFTIDIVNRAVWRFLREAGISSSHYKHDRQEKQGDTILRTYGVKMEKNNGVPNLQGRQSIRRYFRGNSIVIVRKSVILPAGANGVELVEKGWILLSPAAGKAATVTREFSTISPRGHHQKCGLITNSMITTRNEMVDKASQVLENILFEEASTTMLN